MINDAPMMIVNGIDLNRDGIPNVLQQLLVGIRRLSGGPVRYAPLLKTPGPSQNSAFFVCVWNGGADAAVSLVSVDALGTRTLCGLASWSLGPRPVRRGVFSWCKLSLVSSARQCCDLLPWTNLNLNLKSSRRATSLRS